jgi:hypothetical protein
VIKKLKNKLIFFFFFLITIYKLVLVLKVFSSYQFIAMSKPIVFFYLYFNEYFRVCVKISDWICKVYFFLNKRLMIKAKKKIIVLHKKKIYLINFNS